MFNTECYNARKCFNKASNNFLRNKNNVDLLNAYLNAKTSYCKVNTACKRVCLTREQNNCNKLIKAQIILESNKSQHKTQSTSSHNLNITELFDHFKQLFTSDDDINNDNQHEHINDDVNNNDDDIDLMITITQLKRAVFSQSINKASGLDNLPSKIYKHVFNELSPPFLLKLFNRLLEKGTLPIMFWRRNYLPYIQRRKH